MESGRKEETSFLEFYVLSLMREIIYNPDGVYFYLILFIILAYL